MYIIYLLSIPMLGNSLKFIFPIFVIYLFICYLKDKKNLDMILKLLIITPLGAHSLFYNIKGINFGEWIVLLYFLCKLISFFASPSLKLGKNKILDISILVFLFYTFLNTIVSQNGFENKVSDLRVIIFWTILYFIVREYYEKESFNKFLKLLTDSIIFSSLIILFIYFIKIEDKYLLFDWEGRYGNAFQTLYMITIPACIYYLNDKQSKIKEKLFYISGVFIMLFLISINGSRSITVGVSIGIIFIIIKIIKGAFKSKDYKKIILTILFLIVVIGLSSFFIKYLISSNSLIFTRIIDMLNGVNSSINLDTRTLTNSNVEYLLKDKILGYGIGSTMYMINQLGEIYSERLFIDNAFLSLTYKYGIIFIFLFLSIIFLHCFKALYNVFVHKSSIILIFSLLLIIVFGGLITAQLITNFAVAIVFLALMLYSNDKNITI